MAIKSNCCEEISVSLVKVEERGKKAVFKNPERHKFNTIKMDGCVIINARAADWVVIKPHVGTIIIELKGKHVDHASTQIDATASYLSEEKMVSGKMAGLIVATEYPRSTTKIQKAQTSFARLYKGPLHIVTKNGEFDFEKVLSPKGPF